MKTKIQIIVTGLCIALAGCSKDQPVKEKVHLVSLSKESNIEVVNPAANPSNPYDRIGVLHNVLLDSLAKYKARTRDTTFEGTAAYLQQYFKKEGSTAQSSSGRRQILDKSTGIKIIQDYHPYLLRPEFSDQGQAFIRSLMNVLDGITDTEHFERYKTSIVDIEKQVMASGISAFEKRYLLTTSSVMRHSGYHWMKVFSSGLKQKRGFLGFLRKVAGVITGIAADATVVAWHAVKGSEWDVLIEETVMWSEICGYYTGWYPDLPY